MGSVKKFAVKPIGTTKLAPDRDAAADVETFLGVLPSAWEDPREEPAVWDSPWWICLVFQTREQKLEFLRGAGLDPAADQHADGRPFAHLLAGERPKPAAASRRFAVSKLGAKPAPAPKVKTDFQRRAQAERERFDLAVSVDYWVAFCFPSIEERERARVGLAGIAQDHDVYDGLHVAARLGIPIATPSPEWGEPRIRTRWQRYVGQ